MNGRLGWPLLAFTTWLLAWVAYRALPTWHFSAFEAILGGSCVGLLGALIARWLGASKARQIVLVLGFPLSLLLLSTALVPAWAWLLPLVLVLCIYPPHSWRDAPLFPTPLCALKNLPLHAPLQTDAVILDAGCGMGDGLKALRLAYPSANMVGLEFSGPLVWLAKLRCRWATVKQGDIWQDNWGQYDMVYLFQRPESMPRAAAKARLEMKKGAYLISLEFEAQELKPEATFVLKANRQVWVYRTPFQASSQKNSNC